MTNQSNQINPVMVAVVIGLSLIVVIVGGIWYMNKPPKDTIAEAVHQERGNVAPAIARGAPMGGIPPQPGASDYARSRPMPTSGRP